MALAIYEIEGPDGYIYEVEGPDDASDDEILSFISSNWESYRDQDEEEEETFWEKTKRVGGGIAAASTAALAETGSALIDEGARGPMDPVYGLGMNLGRGIGRALRGDLPEVTEEKERPEWLSDTQTALRDVAESERAKAQAARPEGAFGGFGYDVVTAITEQLPSIGVTLATKNPSLGLSMMGVTSYGRAYEEAKRRGANEDMARAEGFKSAALELGPEKLLGIFDKLVGAKTVKDLMGIGGREAASEVLTEAGTIFSEAGKGEDVGSTWDLLKREGYAGVLGAFTGGGMAAATIPSNRAADRANQFVEQDPMADATQALDPSNAQITMERPAPPPPQEAPVEEQAPEPDPYSGFSYEANLGAPTQPAQGYTGYTEGFASPNMPVIEDQARREYDVRVQNKNLVDLDQGSTWNKAFGAAENLPEEAKAIWEDFTLQMDRMAGEEARLFEGLRYRGGGNVQYAPANLSMEADIETVTEQDLLQPQLNQDAIDAQLADEEAEAFSIERAGIADEIEKERTPEAEGWGVAARPENVPYARKGTKGVWQVTAYNPETGRVFVEYESNRGKVAYTWVLDETEAEPHYIYTDEATGRRTNRKRYEKDFNPKQSRPPRDFKEEVNKALRNATRYGTPDVSMEEVNRLANANKFQGSNKILFSGAKPLRQVIQDALRVQRRTARAGGTDLGTELVGKEQAEASRTIRDVPVGRTAAAVTRRTPQELELELVEEIKGRQDKVAETVKQRIAENKNANGDPDVAVPLKLPRLARDGKARILTFISKTARDRMKAGTTLEERAYQVLPDGNIRVLSLELNDRMTGYDVKPESVGTEKFYDAPVIYTIPARVSQATKGRLEKLPGGKTITKKREALRTKRREEARAAEKAAEERSGKQAQPAYEERLAGRQQGTRTEKGKSRVEDVTGREKADKAFRAEVLKQAKRVEAKTKETPELPPVTKGLISALKGSGLISIVDGKWTWAIDAEGKAMLDLTTAEAKYAKKLEDFLLPFYENDLGRSGTVKQEVSLPKLTPDLIESLKNTKYIALDNGTWKWTDAAYDDVAQVRSTGGAVRLTEKGERQRARARALIKTMLKSDMPSEEINKTIAMYRSMLVALNPDIPISEDFSAADLDRFYRTPVAQEIVAYVRKNLAKEPDMMQEYLDLVKASASVWKISHAKAAERIKRNGIVPPTAKKLRQIEELNRGEGATGIPLIPETRDVTQAEAVASTAAVEAAGEKIPSPRPIEGRTLTVDSVEAQLAKLQEESIRSNRLLKETTGRIDRLTKAQIKEANKLRADARKMEARLKGDNAKVGRLSQESIDRLKRLEEGLRTDREATGKGRIVAQEDLKKVLDEIRTSKEDTRGPTILEPTEQPVVGQEFEQWLDDQVAAEELAREEAAAAKPAEEKKAAKKGELLFEQDTAKVREELANATLEASLPKAIGPVELREKGVGIVQGVGPASTPAMDTGYAKLTNQEKKLQSAANILGWKETVWDPAIRREIVEYTAKDAVKLEQTDAWKKLVTPKKGIETAEAATVEDAATPTPVIPPTPANVQRQAEVNDMDSTDSRAQSVFEASVVTSRAGNWLRRHAKLHAAYVKAGKYFRFSRYAGLYNIIDAVSTNNKTKRQVKTKQQIVDKFIRVKGKVRNEGVKAREHWVSARHELKKSGWTRDNRNWQNAINSYLEGTTRNAVEKEYGVKIPDKAIGHLNMLMKHRDQIARLGLTVGAWDRTRTRATIRNGRAYLTHSIANTGRTTQELLGSHMGILIDHARAAWRLPRNDAEVDQMSMHELIRLLNDGTHNIWRSHVKPGPRDTSDKTANELVFSKGNVITPLGKQTKGGRVSEANFLEDIKPIALKDPQAYARLYDAKLKSLREAVKSVLPKDDQAYANALTNLVNSMDVDANAGNKPGWGAVRGLQERRRLLLSDRDQIRRAAITLRQSLDKEDRKAFGEYYESKREQLLTMTFNQAVDMMAKEYPTLALGVKQVRAQNKLNAAMREALNEVTDTESIVYDTIENIATNVYAAEYLGHIARVFTANGIGAIDASSPQAAGLVSLAEKGTSLGDSSFTIPGFYGFRKGHEILVPREIADVVKNQFGSDAGGDQNAGLKIIRGVSSWTKYMMVVFNALAHPRNLFSTRMLHWAANTFSLGGARARSIGAKFSMSQVREAWSEKAEEAAIMNRDPKARILQDWMTTRNMLYDGGRSGVMYDIRERGLGVGPDSMVVNAENEMRKWYGKAWNRVKHNADEWFRLEDESVKGSAFLMQAAEYLQLTSGSQALLDKGLSGKQLDANETKQLNKALDWASEMVLQTYPTFSRTAPIIKAISRNTIIGAFPSFPYEVLRSNINGVLYGASLIEGGITGTMRDGTKIGSNQRAMAIALGLGKLSGRLALWTAGSAAATAVGNLAKDALVAVSEYFDDDDEEEVGIIEENLLTRTGDNYYQRKTKALLPEWARDTLATLSHIDEETGDYTMMSLDYMIPTGAIETVATKMAKRIMYAAETGDENLLLATIKATFEGAASLFLQEEVLFGTFAKRFKKDENVWTYKDDSWIKKRADDVQKALGGGTFGAAAAAVVESVGPKATIDQFADLPEFIEKLYDASLEDDKSDMLKVLLYGAAHVAGLKQRQMSFTEDFPQLFKREEYQMQKAGTRMKNELSTGDYKNYEEFQAAFRAYNNLRRENFDTLYHMVQGAHQVLGRSSEEIQLALREAGSITRAGGHAIENFADGTYYPPTLEEYRETLAKFVPGGEYEDRNDAITLEEAEKRYYWYKQILMENEVVETRKY